MNTEVPCADTWSDSTGWKVVMIQCSNDFWNFFPCIEMVQLKTLTFFLPVIVVSWGK